MFRLLTALLVAATPAMAADNAKQSATAEVADRDGNALGTVSVQATASGTALVTVSLEGLPEGTHGIHLHETGDCSADDFTSAGGHIAGGAAHGVEAGGGPHPGDLPNAVVGPDGTVKLQIFNSRLDIEAMLMDEDGAAFIAHSGADDYTSQPSGAAGERIACGEFVAG